MEKLNLTQRDTYDARVRDLEELLFRFLEQFDSTGGTSQFIGSDDIRLVDVSQEVEDLIVETEQALYSTEEFDGEVEDAG